jgi:hypothetical protein
MQGVSCTTSSDHALSRAADRGRDAYLRPELVEFMLVGVVRPGLGNLAIPDMEHQHGWAANTAPVAFSVRAVQPDNMLVVGHHIMEGSPEGPTRTLDECPEKAEHLVQAFIVARDGLRPGSWKIVVSANTSRRVSTSALLNAS